LNLDEDILIERFLKNELSQKERKQVLKKINLDNNFKEKVIFERQLFNTLNESDWSFEDNENHPLVREYEQLFKSDEVKEIRKSISKARNNYNNKFTNKSRRPYFLSAVASIIILISIYIYFPQKLTLEEIYDNNISNTKLPTLQNRSSNSENLMLDQGLYFFKEKEYLNAEKIFINYLKEKPNDTHVPLYLAVSQIELNKFKKSEKTLNLFIDNDYIDSQKAYWFKSLLYLKSNQINQCRKMLKLIIKNSYYNKKQAKLLLEEINKL